MNRYLLASLALAATLVAAPKDKCKDECAKQAPPPVPKCCMFEEGCTKWYAGAGISFADLFYYSNVETDNTTGNRFSNRDSDNTSTTSAPSLGYNAFLGYSYNDYIDLEVKVAQILKPFENSFAYTFTATGDDDVFTGNVKTYLLSFGPYVLIKMPMYHAFSPFFRFGMVTDLVEYKLTATENDAFDTDDFITRSTSKEYIWAEKFNVGMGFRSNWKDILALTVEYETPIVNTIPQDALSNSFDELYIPGIVSASVVFTF